MSSTRNPRRKWWINTIAYVVASMFGVTVGIVIMLCQRPPMFANVPKVSIGSHVFVYGSNPRLLDRSGNVIYYDTYRNYMVLIVRERGSYGGGLEKATVRELRVFVGSQDETAIRYEQQVAVIYRRGLEVKRYTLPNGFVASFIAERMLTSHQISWSEEIEKTIDELKVGEVISK